MQVSTKLKTRSPLKEPTLPQPGESGTVALYEQLLEIIFLVMLPFGIFCMAVMEWLHFLFKDKPHPMIPTVLFVLASAGAIWKGRKKWRDLVSKALGVKGERAVGQLLERVRAHGYEVFHDLEEDGYNIDHVIIGPGGVFSIETKTRSKPESGKANIIVDGDQLTVNGHTPDRDPIAQAEAAARRVRAILLAQTGREVSCTPVVLFPGWFVEIRTLPKSTFVMNENYFSKWIPDRPKRISRDEIAFLAAGMERHLKARRKSK